MKFKIWRKIELRGFHLEKEKKSLLMLMGFSESDEASIGCYTKLIPDLEGCFGQAISIKSRLHSFIFFRILFAVWSNFSKINFKR
jgi:hypothetical protein